MSDTIKRLLRYLVAYIVFWFAMTQVNSFAAIFSVYFPVYWVFVYFPAMRHDWKVGLTVTALSGIFLESQYLEMRSIFLPLMLVIFLLLHFRRTKVVDSKSGTQIGIASLVHWILVMIPTGVLQLLHSELGSRDLWLRALQDAVTGQLFLFLIYPLLMVGSVVLEGRSAGDEGVLSR